MQTWAKVGVVFITIVLVAGVATKAQGKPEVSINCTAKGGAGTCRLENKGTKTGDAEVDVVLVCHDGEHSSHIAARIEPGNHATKIIDRFTPSVGLLTSCEGIDYRNFTVR